MIKIIEVTFATLFIFLFIMLIFQSQARPEIKQNSLNSKINDLVKYKSQNTEFRELIKTKDTTKIYNLFSKDLDVSNLIRICDYINVDCISTGDIIPVNTTISSTDYYFYDSNKTLSVIAWIG
jgi:hypothetical protein